jgi:hypothetical protein
MAYNLKTPIVGDVRCVVGVFYYPFFWQFNAFIPPQIPRENF